MPGLGLGLNVTLPSPKLGSGIAAISGLVVVNITATGFGVQWNAPGVTPDTVRVQRQASGGDWSTLLFEDVVDPPATSINEANLFVVPGAGNTFYDVRVRAEIGPDHGPWTTITGLTLPAVPVITSATPGGASGELDITWTGYTYNSYDVYYNLVDDFSTATLYQHMAPSPRQIAGLTPATLYYVYVTEFNSSGTSAPGSSSGTSQS